MDYTYKRIDSPAGELKLVALGNKLIAILWEQDREGRVRLPPIVEADAVDILEESSKQLAEYFSGHRTEFDLAVHFEGTEFQQKVWKALLTIPYGETRTYGEIAKQIGSPRAVRAVGAACGKNPIPIIAPCHRVIGSAGALTGFAGGLGAKQILLMGEGWKRRTGTPQSALRRDAKTSVAQRALFDAEPASLTV